MFKKMMLCILTVLCFSFSFTVSASSYDSDGDTKDIFTVYLEDGTFLFERTNVVVGDIYINNSFEQYIVISVNEVYKTGVAKFDKLLIPPKVEINYDNPSQIDTSGKVIALYSTHNDESYITGDGYDSIYGAGGIHDVAKLLKNKFVLNGITSTYDETLHIPHDTLAYSRSSVTAKALMKDLEPNAIFDIHRDGASRSTYVKSYNGNEVCKIRMVVGKGNSSYSNNQEFALYLMSVAQEIYPWLFLDIYFGSGHYNQALSSKAMLFEMGSHLVEKSLVLKSVEPLAEVISIALFGTTVSDDGTAIIGGNTNVNPTVDEYLESINNNEENNFIWLVPIVIFISLGLSIGGYYILKWYKNKKSNKKKG